MSKEIAARTTDAILRALSLQQHSPNTDMHVVISQMIEQAMEQANMERSPPGEGWNAMAPRLR